MRNVVLRVSPLVLLGMLLGAAPASAHAELISSSPQDGSSVKASPAGITLTFSGDVHEPAYVVAHAPDGSAVKVSAVDVDGGTVSATLAPSDMRGRHSAGYRVISADGHPVEGVVEWTTTTGRIVSPADSGESGFVERNRSHFFWGILAAAVAIALLLAPLRGRDESHDA